MNDSPHPVDDPAKAMERMREAMKRIVTVSKPEILRREDEAQKERKKKRKAA
jgi:hypothetical protein